MPLDHEENKKRHSKRIQQKENYVEKQSKIAKSHGMEVKNNQKHRLAKHSATTCGDSNCVMCGNPRKFFKEPTIQEKSFVQTQNWQEKD